MRFSFNNCNNFLLRRCVSLHVRFCCILLLSALSFNFFLRAMCRWCMHLKLTKCVRRSQKIENMIICTFRADLNIFIIALAHSIRNCLRMNYFSHLFLFFVLFLSLSLFLCFSLSISLCLVPPSSNSSPCLISLLI